MWRLRFEVRMTKETQFLLCCILGNDVPPRHDRGQTLQNTLFILDHEQLPAGFERRWLLNRIVDVKAAQKLATLIASRGEECTRIEFERERYAGQFLDASGMPPRYDPAETLQAVNIAPWQVPPLEWLYRHKNIAALDLNGARNFVIEEGHKIARWTLPLDNGSFMTGAGLTQLRQLAEAHPEACRWHFSARRPMKRAKRRAWANCCEAFF